MCACECVRQETVAKRHEFSAAKILQPSNEEPMELVLTDGDVVECFRCAVKRYFSLPFSLPSRRLAVLVYVSSNSHDTEPKPRSRAWALGMSMATSSVELHRDVWVSVPTSTRTAKMLEV